MTIEIAIFTGEAGGLGHEDEEERGEKDDCAGEEKKMTVQGGGVLGGETTVEGNTPSK